MQWSQWPAGVRLDGSPRPGHCPAPSLESENFNWRGIGFLGEHCPEPNDICVKLIEQRGGKQDLFVFVA